ncbi:hypothetical protein HBI56_109400 [Parastagonospora nodorum]|nr:hypothetical protein HBH56_041970 [Parastagonospora nodorum]KAH3932958.1 hypothetical protein HBH54_069720 [Parastagonospora nodorum]KAH3943391.1 hypothetical protein HBH53_173890 [Parastagonospora nodorum]KAH3961862.1 hypothetical protein HBH52_229090 [Parastagonospora nodorum]KAH4004481.1 hypothetical protein HBI10_048760 [Parastagonospora nodorum]
MAQDLFWEASPPVFPAQKPVTFPRLFRAFSAMLSGEESLAELAPRAHLPNSSIGSSSLQQPWKRAAAMENFSSLLCC